MQRPSPQSIEIGGTKYKVHASAPQEELDRLALVVDRKLREIDPRGRGVTSPQTFLLVALALAHDAEAEREKRLAVEAEARDLLRRVLTRIDHALEDDGDADEDAPADVDADEHPVP